jgi:DNA primase
VADAADQVRAQLDILEVIGGYVSLHRAGREHVGLCPFHAEKTPSFTVSKEKQLWHCHGCGRGGDIFTFVEGIENVDFRRALEILAERAGVELEHDPRSAARGARRRRSLELNAAAARYFEYVLWDLPAGEPGRRLLAERQVAEPLARRFRVGYAPEGGPGGDGLVRYLRARGATVAEAIEAGLATRGGRDLFRDRVVFPIADERGQVVAFGGRTLGADPRKYLNTPDTDLYHKSTALFGLDQARDALRERREAVVVEGYFDVLAAHAAGAGTAVASSGTALTREQVRILARHADRVVLCFDGDSAGRRAAERAVELCAAESLPARIAVMPPGVKDPDEMVRRDPAGLAALLDGAGAEWDVLLGWAMGEVGSSPEDRRAAGDRALKVLARIPDPVTREPYVARVMQRLELWEGSGYPAQVARAAAVRQREAPDRAPAAPPVPPGPGSPEAETPAAAWEEYLAIVAVQRPELARVAVDELGLRLDELVSQPVRRILDAALLATPGATLWLRTLSEADRPLAARLSVKEPPPELAGPPDPVALQRGIADSVRRVHAAARERELRRLRDRIGSDPAAAERIRELIAEQAAS